MRCDYCIYRNSWECEDWRVSDEYICKEFKLDFDALSESQKKAIQKALMGKEERRNYDW